MRMLKMSKNSKKENEIKKRKNVPSEIPIIWVNIV